MSTPGAPPSSMKPSVRHATLRRAICVGTRISFTAAENISPMPTATGAGTPRNSTRTGTVMVPAPTPVSAMNSAMKNPINVLHCVHPQSLVLVPVTSPALLRM